MPFIRHYDPFREMEDLLENFWEGNIGSAQPTLTTPTSDVYTEGEGDDQKLMIEAHLPGFSENDVDVSVHEGALEIRAEQSEKEEDKDKRKYIVRESSASFYRRIGLPKNVDTDSIQADFEDGILKVSLPFKELPQPKQVKIGKSGK